MRVFLIIPMAILELLLLVVNWIVAFINPKAGEAMMKWNMKALPNRDWYTKKSADNNAIRVNK